MNLVEILELGKAFDSHQKGAALLVKAMRTTDTDCRWINKLSPADWRDTILLSKDIGRLISKLEREDYNKIGIAVQQCAYSLATHLEEEEQQKKAAPTVIPADSAIIIPAAEAIKPSAASFFRGKV